MQVLGSENIPLQGPCLVTANHWSRAGFQGWWIPFAISACMPFEMHWVMTNAWRFEGHPLAAQLEKLSRWGFRRVAHTYGFTSMPSMPPRDAETQARSQAVRHLLRYAREHDSPVIGLAPEGYNMPGGLLGHPPAGVGRLIVHLIPYTQRIIPVAVFETQERLCLRIGEAYTIEKPIRAEPEIIDHLTSDTVMQAIAQLLPFHLRGAYS
jgi:1-acyl-sn-glycerol-3-phosphate acyltransferase